MAFQVAFTLIFIFGENWLKTSSKYQSDFVVNQGSFRKL